MNRQSSPIDDDLLRLFDRVCAEGLDAGNAKALQDSLRSTPNAAASYLAYVGMHADLYNAVQLRRVGELIGVELGASVPQDAAAARIDVRARPPKVPRALALAASALAATAAVWLAIVMWPRPPGENGDFGLWPDGVAVVQRLSNVEWGPDAHALSSGEVIARGQTIRLEGGFLEVAFRQGAIVVIEGPAELVATGHNDAKLVHGGLAALAPPWATGFAVDTPKLKVIDYGTRFAVSVDDGEVGRDVSVLVTEGEVEVQPTSGDDRPQMLLAGEGLRATDSGHQELVDRSDAMRLTSRLPESTGGSNKRVVGDRWHDWVEGEVGKPRSEGPWRHFVNVDGPFGEPQHYEPLVWRKKDKVLGAYAPDRSRVDPGPDGLGFVKVHRDGGHPGLGKAQSADGLDHYSISAFIVPEDGVYRIEAGWLERPEPKRWDLDHVLDIAAHVNDGPVLFREFCNRDCFVRFGGDLGDLKRGDTIFVGVGPGGVDHNDRFRWGFMVVREEVAAPDGGGDIGAVRD